MKFSKLFLTTAALALTFLAALAFPARAAFINGTVADSQTGFPVEGASIIAFGFDPAIGDSIIYTATTLPDGSYLINNAIPATYFVSTEHPGYQHAVQGPFVISPNTAGITVDFQLLPLGLPLDNYIAGTVFDAQSAVSIPGAMVGLAHAGAIFYQTVSDSAGDYRFEDIMPGGYFLTAHAPGYLPFFGNFPIQVEPNTQIDDLDIFLIPDTLAGGLGTLTGFVFSADSVNTFPQPVFPAFIELLRFDPATGDSLFYRTMNNPDGSYTISGIVPGFYHASCYANGFQPRHLPNFPIQEGPNALDFFLVPFIPLPGGTISGTVAFDGSGAPVEGAFLEFITVNGFPHHFAFSDAQGQYSAELPVGDYIVSVVVGYPALPYYYQEFYDDVHSIAEATIVQVFENQVSGGIDFGVPDSLSPITATISGQVTDNNAQPLENALVTIFSSNAGGVIGDSLIFTGLTDAQGNYAIEVSTIRFPFGVFIASAEKEGYLVEFWEEKPAIFLADPIFVFSDTVITGIDFTLDPVGTPTNNSISGAVTSDNGAALNGAFVVGSDIFTGRIVFTFADSSGNYTLDGLDPHPHIILFAANGHVPEFFDNALTWEEAIPVPALGAVTGIDAALTPVNNNPAGGMVAGTVLNMSGGPLSGVFLTILNDAGEVIGYDFTDAQGGYQVAGMTNGNYTVQATKISYHSESEAIQFNAAAGNTMVVNFDLAEVTTGVEPDPQAGLPSSVELPQNYPNPFNPSTTIRFVLPQAQQTRLVIYNILGQAVKELVNENLPAGRYELLWNGADQNGRQVASGIYFYVLEAGALKLTRRMVFSK